MTVPYRKALDPANGCSECGHFIGLVTDGEYICSHCGWHEPKNEQRHCLCWVAEEMCPIHGGEK